MSSLNNSAWFFDAEILARHQGPRSRPTAVNKRLPSEGMLSLCIRIPILSRNWLLSISLWRPLLWLGVVQFSLATRNFFQRYHWELILCLSSNLARSFHTNVSTVTNGEWLSRCGSRRHSCPSLYLLVSPPCVRHDRLLLRAITETLFKWDRKVCVLHLPIRTSSWRQADCS